MTRGGTPDGKRRANREGNICFATADRYQLIIETYTIPRIGKIKLTKLTSRDLQKLYKDLIENGRVHAGKNQSPGLSSTTVRSVHLMLHCAFERAVKERLISRNPTNDCITPKIQKFESKDAPARRYESILGRRQHQRAPPHVLPSFGQRPPER